MITHKQLARDVPDAFAEHLVLPRSFARQVITALKVAGRIAAARPVSPPVAPRAIARILLALASPAIKDAVQVGAELGALPLSAGDGQPTAEDQLTDMIEEAAGWRNGAYSFRDGQMVIGTTAGTVLIGDNHYSAPGARVKGLQRHVSVTHQAVAGIARELLPTTRIHADA